MHFMGKAHRWKQGYLVDKPGITWAELSEAVYKRYDSTGMKRLVREFNKLVQTHTVKKYQEKFEDLRARMLYINPTLSEEHFIQSYISGLKEELIPFIDLSNPTTLDEVYEQAKLHEQAIAVMWRRNKFAGRFSGTSPQGSTLAKPAGQASGNHQKDPPGSQNSSRQLFEQRKAAGLCYRCGDKFQPGHRCQPKALNSLNTTWEADEVFDEYLLQVEEEEGTEDNLPAREEEVEEKGMSVHALSGESKPETIKIQGEIGAKTLVVLIDTGSTHSFIDFQVAKEVKAAITSAPPLVVTVANGHRVLSKLKCPSFKWTMQGEPYQADLRVIRLDGSSIILGIDWLRAYGKVTFDYIDNSVFFSKEGKPTTLKGIEEGSKFRTSRVELKTITAKQWYREGLEGNCCAIGRLIPAGGEGKEEATIPTEVQQVLERF